MLNGISVKIYTILQLLVMIKSVMLSLNAFQVWLSKSEMVSSDYLFEYNWICNAFLDEYRFLLLSSFLHPFSSIACTTMKWDLIVRKKKLHLHLYFYYSNIFYDCFNYRYLAKTNNNKIRNRLIIDTTEVGKEQLGKEVITKYLCMYSIIYWLRKIYKPFLSFTSSGVLLLSGWKETKWRGIEAILFPCLLWWIIPTREGNRRLIVQEKLQGVYELSLFTDFEPLQISNHASKRLAFPLSSFNY